MGLLDKLFGKEKDKPEKDFSFIEEIAGLISENNSDVMEKIDLCIEHPQAYSQQNAERYEERGIDADDADYDEICWIGMVDELSENGYLFSVDYNCGLEDFLWALSQIKSYSLIESTVSKLKLDESQDIEAWGEEINFALKDEAFLCMVDIDSDSYELIIVNHDVYEKIYSIAKNNGYSIEEF